METEGKVPPMPLTDGTSERLQVWWNLRRWRHNVAMYAILVGCCSLSARPGGLLRTAPAHASSALDLALAFIGAVALGGAYLLRSWAELCAWRQGLPFEAVLAGWSALVDQPLFRFGECRCATWR